jgi:hypothetical protein
MAVPLVTSSRSCRARLAYSPSILRWNESQLAMMTDYVGQVRSLGVDSTRHRSSEKFRRGNYLVHED